MLRDCLCSFSDMIVAATFFTMYSDEARFSNGGGVINTIATTTHKEVLVGLGMHIFKQLF